MKTLSVSISELEFDKFGLKKEKIAFSDLIELVSNEISKKNLRESTALANEYGLSAMSMSQITKEVKAVRKHAKSNT